MLEKKKRRIFEILELAEADDLLSRIFDIFILSLISLNVVAVILQTVSRLSDNYASFFYLFELFSVATFTVEYLLRIWSCTADERFSAPLTGRLRFAITPMALVDLIAILPFYLPFAVSLDLRFVRAIRLLRLLRLFKLGRYSTSLKTLGNIFRQKKEELYITAFIVTIMLIIASSLMYFIENEAQPKAFSSIPAALWWGVATLTTVGYGDIYPVTALGRLLGAVIAVLGIGMFALPAGILSSGFAEEISKRNSNQKKCPQCGSEIDDT